MDKNSGKKGVTGTTAPKKAYKVCSRDATTANDQNAQFCNRIGCHGRIKYNNQNTNTGISGKAKCAKPSTNRNDMIGGSSRSGSIMTRAKRSYLDSKRKLSSRSESGPSESSQSGDSEAPQSMSSPGRSPSSHHSGSSNMSREPSGSSSSPSNARPRKMNHPKPWLNNQNIPAASSVLSVSRSSVLGTLSSSNKNRCLKTLKCNSISDVIPRGCSSSGSKSAGKKVMKTSTGGESSLSRRVPLTSGVSISGSRCSSSSITSGDDGSGGGGAVRIGSSTYTNQSRMRFSYQTNGRNSSRIREPAVRISLIPGSEPHGSIGRPSLSHQFSLHGSSSSMSSYSLSSSNDDNWSPITSAELGFSNLVYSIDGIAEVLLAHDRIDPTEMTHEEILALESSLFPSSFNLYDQHRDMRLDIDDMSYEELLALGERMGTVSTALSEEALSKCLRRSVYEVAPSEERSTVSGEYGDDIKCSICQEEYGTGDELGKLVECQHAYHIACINQWLRLKNWCPICNSAAAPPSSRPSS